MVTNVDKWSPLYAEMQTEMKCAKVPSRVFMKFCERIDQSDTSGCWPWTGSVHDTGYGQISWYFQGKQFRRYAHRVAWSIAHGPIMDGLTVDHKCHNRKCCNPAHLRLMSNRDNASDNGWATKMNCPAGHAYDEENTYYRPDRPGHRGCRACRHDAMVRFWQKKRYSR